MDRVYMNRRTGEQRIHVEIDAAEVRELLAKLMPRDDDGAVHRLAEILRTADRAFTP
ncbi:hypothetical protein OHR86_22505 [Streptomyces sp. NBC_00441]|uniref:hypothetical protein n=1 Tax=Streptomyces sp. NBC_00441 TaxID=2975742 RepID=UPI002E2A29B9|nr:hypothetical protein [Streptomyces sp. NBC_00441]